MQPLIDRLKTQHDVTVFTRRYRRDTPVEEGIDGVKVIRYKKLNRLYLHILEACDAEKKARALETGGHRADTSARQAPSPD
jgi:hypothetical protein